MRNSGFSFSTFLEIGQPNKVPKSGIRSRSAAATDSSLDELRTADIVPVFKKEVQNDKTNYRMISLLPVISIFEKVSCADNFANKILSPKLCRFRKGNTIQHALLNLSKNWNCINGPQQSMQLFST